MTATAGSRSIGERVSAVDVKSLPRQLALRHFVATVLVYLMVEPELALHGGRLKVGFDHGAEALVLLVAIYAAARRFHRVWERLGLLLLPIGLLVVFWIVTGIGNHVRPSTMFVGMEWELRFLPLVVVVAAAANPLKDARLYGQVLVVGAAVESLFALQWAVGLTGFQSTFEQKNVLGAFLALAVIYLTAAGPRALGFSTPVGAGLAALIVVGIISSGSREGGIAAAIGLLVVAFMRYPWPVKVAAAAVGALAATLLIAASLHNLSGETNTHGVFNRWKVVYTKASLAPSRNIRTRLLVNNAKLVDRTKPVLGFGIGMASDRRVVYSLRSPVFVSLAPLNPQYIKHYVYDSNWAIVLLETGWVGVLLLAGLFAYLIVIGILAARRHWIGRVLACTALAVAALGFFGSAFHEPLVSAMLWLTAGACCAIPAPRRLAREGYIPVATAAAAALVALGVYAAVKHPTSLAALQPFSPGTLVRATNAQVAPPSRYAPGAALIVSNANPGAYSVRMASNGKLIKVTPKLHYSFGVSVFGATRKPQTIVARIVWKNAKGKVLSRSASAPVTSSRPGTFQQLLVTSRAPRKATRAVPVIAVVGKPRAGSRMLVQRAIFQRFVPPPPSPIGPGKLVDYGNAFVVPETRNPKNAVLHVSSYAGGPYTLSMIAPNGGPFRVRANKTYSFVAYVKGLQRKKQVVQAYIEWDTKKKAAYRNVAGSIVSVREAGGYHRVEVSAVVPPSAAYAVPRLAVLRKPPRDAAILISKARFGPGEQLRPHKRHHKRPHKRLHRHS
jgi:hypothetical protein